MVRVLVLALVLAAGCDAALLEDTTQSSTSTPGPRGGPEDPGGADLGYAENLDSHTLPDFEMASGMTYRDGSGRIVTIPGGSCSGILIKYSNSGGSSSACINRPCKSNPSSRDCKVRQAIAANFYYYFDALEVAFCESRFTPTATNGQYHGLYQLSSAWRVHYGIGEGYEIQPNVIAAHRIKAEYGGGGLGWQPWECQPR